MSIKLFKDLNRPLTHRDLDENFESVVKIIEELGNTSFTPEIALGPTMTISSGLNSIPNTRKFVGKSPQSGDGTNYTYAKDADAMFRKGSYRGGFFVDEEGNSIKSLYTKYYGPAIISANGKWIISGRDLDSIYVINVETNKYKEYSISSFWSDGHVNDIGGCLIYGDYVYIPGRQSSYYHIFQLKLNQDTGELTPEGRVQTGRTFRASYIVYGKDQIAMSDAGNAIYIYNAKTDKARKISCASSINDISVAFMPIGFGSDGKAHFMLMDLRGGTIYDIHNIYVEHNGSVAPHAVSKAVSNQLTALGEGFSKDWPDFCFIFMDLEAGPIYVSFFDGSEQMPTAFYNPDTFEFASLSDQSEGLFITKGD